ncbi:MAG: DUF4272 domain-containing protein [Phycisphaerales bacterium]
MLRLFSTSPSRQTMRADAVRSRTAESLRALQLAVPSTLPTLGEVRILRTQDDVVRRMMAMHATAASAYGYPRSETLGWLERFNCAAALTAGEHGFLASGAGSPAPFAAQIEGIWALAWVVSVVGEMHPLRPCSEDFVKLMPDIRVGESPDSLRASVSLRASAELAGALDLYYCIDWGIREASLRGRAADSRLSPAIITQRRRALEWVASQEAWEDLVLDT